MGMVAHRESAVSFGALDVRRHALNERKMQSKSRRRLFHLGKTTRRRSARAPAFPVKWSLLISKSKATQLALHRRQHRILLSLTSYARAHYNPREPGSEQGLASE